MTDSRQSQRLAGLVETMLDVSMVASGRLRLKLEEVDLAVLVADSVAQLREEPMRRLGLDLWRVPPTADTAGQKLSAPYLKCTEQASSVQLFPAMRKR